MFSLDNIKKQTKKPTPIYYQDQTLPTSTDTFLPDQGLFFQSNPFSSPLQPISWQLHNCSVHLVLWSFHNNFPGDTKSNGLMKCELETLPFLLFFFIIIFLKNGVLQNRWTKSQDTKPRLKMYIWETHVAFHSTFHTFLCLKFSFSICSEFLPG